MFNLFTFFLSIILLSGCSIAEVDCEQIKAEARELLNQANYCEKNDDCVVLELGFKHHFLACYNLGNKDANLSSIKKKGRKFFKSGCPFVVYAFCESPKLEEIKCIEGKCVDARFQKDE